MVWPPIVDFATGLVNYGGDIIPPLLTIFLREKKYLSVRGKGHIKYFGAFSLISDPNDTIFL